MLLTVKEYAKKLGISRAAVYYAMKVKRIPYVIQDDMYYINSNTKWKSQKRLDDKYKNISYTTLYHIWQGILNRCYNINEPAYRLYGGRGITVCKKWRDSPEEFIDWANSNGYKKGLDLDRKNVNGDYEPSNCRFVTRRINCNNKRNTIYVSYKGEKIPISLWCEENNLPYSFVQTHTKKGFTGEEIIEMRKKITAKKVNPK